MRWLTLLLLIVLGAGVYAAVRFVQQSPGTITHPVGATPGLPPNVHLRLQRISLTGRKDGRPSWTMTADRLDTTRDHNELDIVGNIRAQLLQEGKVRAIVTAPMAHYSSLPKLLSATGPVLVTMKPQTPQQRADLRITADRVLWNIGTRQLNCPGKVRATEGDSIAIGDSLSVDLKTRDMTARNFAISLPVNSDGTLMTPTTEISTP